MTSFYTELPGSYRATPCGAVAVGPVLSGEPVALSVYLKPGAGLAGAIEMVSRFAAAAGLTLAGVDPARRLVRLAAPAERIEAALHTRLTRYRDGARCFRARSGTLSAPAEMVRAVEAVLGLDTRPAATPAPVAHLPEGVPDGRTLSILLDGETDVPVPARTAVHRASNTVQGLVDAVSRAVHEPHDRPALIALGWRLAERRWTGQAMAALDAVLRDAAARGIAIVGPSGAVGRAGDLSGGAGAVAPLLAGLFVPVDDRGGRPRVQPARSSSLRAMTCAWISPAPSKMLRMRASASSLLAG